MASLISVEEAIGRVLERVQVVEPETVRLEDAAGRLLAEPARARLDLPPFASSAMDGFAIRAADAPGTLPVVDRIAAGRPAAKALAPGEAMAIATGGVVPTGADCVVPLELVVTHGNTTIEVPSDVAHGDNIRPRGGDIAAGGVALAAGVRLSSSHLAALAACGLNAVRCARRPRVAVLTTGTELRRPGAALAPGEIYESNGIMLASALAQAGGVVEPLPSVEDDLDAHRNAIERGLAADVLVSSGGVSVGPHDLVRRVEAEAGVEEVFWGVAMRPGKPIAFGVRGRTLVFGLPGNPVSSLVGCLLFVRPAILALQGAIHPTPRFLHGTLGTTVKRNAARDNYLRARTSWRDGVAVVTPIAGQESHMIVRAAQADALIHIPRGEGVTVAGDDVAYLALD